MDKINRLIATEIMGWHEKIERSNKRVFAHWFDSSGNPTGYDTDKSELLGGEVWNPWEVIAHAFDDVVEHIKKELDLYLELVDNGDGWVAEFVTHDNWIVGYDKSDTPEMAICLAALNVKAITYDEQNTAS